MPDGRDIAARGKIHYRIGAVLYRIGQLLQLFINVGCDCRIADVGVDLAAGSDADGHRLEVLVVNVGGNDRSPPRYFRTHQFRSQPLAIRHVVHFFRDGPLARIVHLRADAVVLSLSYPVCAHYYSWWPWAGRPNRSPPAPGLKSCYFFFLGFFTSFLGLLSLATQILPMQRL